MKSRLDGCNILWSAVGSSFQGGFVKLSPLKTTEGVWIEKNEPENIIKLASGDWRGEVTKISKPRSREIAKKILSKRGRLKYTFVLLGGGEVDLWKSEDLDCGDSFRLLTRQGGKAGEEVSLSVPGRDEDEKELVKLCLMLNLDNKYG